MVMAAQGKTSSVQYRLGYYNDSTMGMAADSKVSVFNRLGNVSPPDRCGKVSPPAAKKTCIYWAKGRCNKFHCPYLHTDQTAQRNKQFLAPKKQHSAHKTMTKQHSLDTGKKQLLAPQIKQMVVEHLKPGNKVNTAKRNMTWRNEKLKNTLPSQKQESDSRPVPSRSESNEISTTKSEPVEFMEASSTEGTASTSENNEINTIKCSKSEPVEGTSVEKCETLHTSSQVAGLTKLAELKGHSKAIAGIALPSSSTKLYTGCKDKSVRVWDCSTGQCTTTELLNDEVVCMITRGPWLFAGVLNNIKAWNLDHRVECPLNVTGGRVYSMEFQNDILFAGMEDGSILVWKRNPDTSEFELVANTKSHTGPVLSLVMEPGHGKLYSSSDSSVKVWDQKMQCIQTLDGHTREVTSLVCWDKYLLSSSLDKTLKVWSQTESGYIEMVHELKEDHGFVSMGGIILRPEGQYTLLCSLDDKSVRLYDSSFVEKGRISSKEQASVIQVGIDGLFFIGDEVGNVSVWKLA